MTDTFLSLIYVSISNHTSVTLEGLPDDQRSYLSALSFQDLTKSVLCYCVARHNWQAYACSDNAGW